MVSPLAEGRQRFARAAAGVAVGGQRSRKLGADCHGAGCIELGACRDATCRTENVLVEGGHLILLSDKHSSRGESVESHYTTGAVSTWNTSAWRPSDGSFRACISARLPGHGGKGSSQGIWPAHWMMPRDGGSLQLSESDSDLSYLPDLMPISIVEN